MTLARWDARWKLAAILLACAIAASLQTPHAAASAFAIAILLSILAGVSASKLIARLSLIALSLVPFLMILPFVQDDGAMLALTIALKAFGIGTLAYVLAASGPVDRTLAAAQSLGVPGPLVQITLLTNRYMHLLMDEFRRLRIAWRVRAFQAKPSLHTYRTYAHGIGAVLVRSGDRGERVSAAMRARGFDGTFHHAVPFHATPVDALGSAALVLAMLGLVCWERLA